jgi:hypothetical protein
MPKLAAKAHRVLAAHLVREAEVLQRMAREALAEPIVSTSASRSARAPRWTEATRCSMLPRREHQRDGDTTNAQQALRRRWSSCLRHS